ncbi:hypothetical protein EV644_103280 [Kribbella orskensis]|uniref:Uncharacterized protein n=1 Tax=Kribbella orskensis TaxID=2512216 RepID=A0ABY2BQG2_9ACTN|nr:MULTISPECIES: hypothetical protein [Kribbella]TCO27581.1 hypothetical protein EV644_103280 [Kribbella orskensis]
MRSEGASFIEAARRDAAQGTQAVVDVEKVLHRGRQTGEFADLFERATRKESV